MITPERFKEILEGVDGKWEGDNALQGLLIMQKYMPNKTLICGADHDVIYSVEVEELCNAGITEEDTLKIAMLNWSIDDCYLICFV